jgi:hypothetical protein
MLNLNKYSLPQIQTQIDYVQDKIKNGKGKDNQETQQNLSDLKEMRERLLADIDWDTITPEERDVWYKAQADWVLEDTGMEDIDVSEKCPQCGHWHDDCNNGTSLCNWCLFPYPKRY